MAALTTTSLSVRGSVRVPGDKSISHRALILSALAKGSSRVKGILVSADVKSTAGALRALGANIPELSSDISVTGTALRAPSDPLDCGNSGTSARLLAGVVAGAAMTAKFIGDASLSRRPMRRIAEPLRAMGAKVDLPRHGGLPMTVMGAPLHRIDYHSAIASAQVKSAVLLAATVAGVSVRISEPELSRDHTERMLTARGVEVLRSAPTTVELAERQTIMPLDLRIPADPSSAAFFVALAVLADAGELRVTDVCLNETRIGFLDVLRRAGGAIELVDIRMEGGEPVGTIVARPSRHLMHAPRMEARAVPTMIDELPLLACVASRIHGECVVHGAAELRAKESDRIATVVNNLRTVGVKAEELADGFRVTGSRTPLRGRVRANGDHRIAMAFGILGALPGNEIEIDDPKCVAVSYPNFWTDLQAVTR